MTISSRWKSPTKSFYMEKNHSTLVTALPIFDSNHKNPTHKYATRFFNLNYKIPKNTLTKCKYSISFLTRKEKRMDPQNQVGNKIYVI